MMKFGEHFGYFTFIFYFYSIFLTSKIFVATMFQVKFFQSLHFRCRACLFTGSFTIRYPRECLHYSRVFNRSVLCWLSTTYYCSWSFSSCISCFLITNSMRSSRGNVFFYWTFFMRDALGSVGVDRSVSTKVEKIENG